MILLVSRYKKLRTILGYLPLYIHIYLYKKKSQKETSLNHQAFMIKLRKIKIKIDIITKNRWLEKNS